MVRTAFRSLARSFVFAVVPLALASAGFCSTWIVDANNGPGTNFTDIPPALAVAVPGDVIVVRAGGYSAFTLTRGIAIVGQPGATTAGKIQISGVPAGQVAVLKTLQPQPSSWGISIANCAGTVVVQSVIAPIVALDTADVRCFQVSTGSPEVRVNGLWMMTARVSATECNFRGGNGALPPLACGESGAPAIFCQALSKLHFVNSTATGGMGNCDMYFCGGFGYCYPGGAGIYGSASELLLARNGGLGQIAGGIGGGGVAASMFLAGCTAWSSNMAYSTAPNLQSGSTITYLAPPEPTLELVGTPGPGATVLLRLRGQPGSLARLIAGAVPVVQQSPNVLAPRLVLARASLDLGVIPPSGVVDTPWGYRQGARTGQLTIFQANLVLPIGQVQRSNSIEAVVP